MNIAKEKNMYIPDYEKGILSTMSAIRAYFGLDTYQKIDDELYAWLQDHCFQQVVVMLIDGMGAYQIDRYCEEKGFLKTYQKKIVDTVYPPTTVAATTAILNGKQPCVNAWLGWQQYFLECDENIVMFFDEDFYTEQKKEKGYVQKQLPVTNMIEECMKKGIQASSIYPAWRENGAKNFQELCDKVVEKSHGNDRLVYAYWDQYDSIMHTYGATHKKSVEMLRSFDDILQHTMKELPETTGLMIIADHGHIDVRNDFLNRYPDLVECFDHLPALEPRTIAFYIKKDKQEIFKKLFLSYFGSDFKLFTKQEIIDMKLFGNEASHPRFQDFLGDFIACAISDLNLDYDDCDIILGSHAGATKEEIQIPVILYEGKKKVR